MGNVVHLNRQPRHIQSGLENLGTSVTYLARDIFVRPVRGVNGLILVHRATYMLQHISRISFVYPATFVGRSLCSGPGNSDILFVSRIPQGHPSQRKIPDTMYPCRGFCETTMLLIDTLYLLRSLTTIYFVLGVTYTLLVAANTLFVRPAPVEKRHTCIYVLQKCKYNRAMRHFTRTAATFLGIRVHGFRVL